jgi:DNA-binding transcriptional MerR regulator
VSAATISLGLLSGQEAGRHLGVDPATVRSWRARGYITPVVKTRDGSRVTSWYRTDDLWACAKARLGRTQLAKIRDMWAEVDELVAKQQARCHSDL